MTVISLPELTREHLGRFQYINVEDADRSRRVWDSGRLFAPSSFERQTSIRTLHVHVMTLNENAMETVRVRIAELDGGRRRLIG